MRGILVIAMSLVLVVRMSAGSGDPEKTTSQSEALWGAPKNGLSTRVSMLEKSPAVGQPLRVRYEIKNVDTSPHEYDAQQSGVNNSVHIKGPDGKDVPYIGTSFQTMGDKVKLAPGASNVVIKELDLAEQYLLDQPGKYTVQFRERNGLPASNEISVTLKDGPLPEMTKLFASIHRAAPAGWRAARYDETIVLLNTPTRLKADATSITIYFTKGQRDPFREGRTEPVSLGNTRLGEAKIVLGPKAAERWPDHVKFFQEQLKPFAKTN